MNKSLSKLVASAWLCVALFTGNTFGQSCTELVPNGSFTNFTGTFNTDEFCTGQVTSWQAFQGSPQIGGGVNAHTAPYFAYMWGANTFGEGIASNVSITSGKKYVLTYWYRRSFATSVTLDNLIVRLGTGSIGGCSFGLPATTQLIDQVTGVTSGTWAQRQICFTANNNYGSLYLYPQSNSGSAVWADVDDVSIVELKADAGPDQHACAAVTLGPNCDIPGTTYSWSPATGLSSTTVRNPTANPGTTTTYTLTITGPGGCSVVDQVLVDPACCPVPGFTATPQSNCGMLFNSTSTLTNGTIISYNWDFGDGTTGSGASPSHTYSYGGTYRVCLTVVGLSGGECCIKKYCEEITLANCPAQPCNITPNFNSSVLNMCAYQYQLNGSATAPGVTLVGWYWEFGDGTTGTGQNPIHTFPGPGIYNVCLTVVGQTASGCCKNKICLPVNVVNCEARPQNQTGTQTGVQPHIAVYPNPSEGTTTLEYEVSETGNISVTLYNIEGQVIKSVLTNEPQKAGTYTVKLSGSDIAAGTYICKVQINDAVYTERVVIIK